jgi:hypothetical protein
MKISILPLTKALQQVKDLTELADYETKSTGHMISCRKIESKFVPRNRVVMQQDLELKPQTPIMPTFYSKNKEKQQRNVERASPKGKIKTCVCLVETFNFPAPWYCI